LHEFSTEGNDVAWGTGELNLDDVLESIHNNGIRPSLFGLEYSLDWDRERPGIPKSMEYFNNKSIMLSNDN
ncbi:MAG: hypothetical protein KAT15_10795, partial [Bacteroidales bacterium]|nr:hypothetical protein [Bacteroidales bacterium]